MDRMISIKCKGSRTLDLADINEFQGDLKELTKENYDKLRGIILKHGYSFAAHVWADPATSKWMLIDGHQRIRVLKMLKNEGWFIPALPVVEVSADSFKEAKEKILAGTSQYGRMTDDGLYEFVNQAGIDVQFLSEVRFPELDLDKWVKGFGGPSEIDHESVIEVESNAKTCPHCGEALT